MMRGLIIKISAYIIRYNSFLLSAFCSTALKKKKGGKNTALRILTISYEKPETNVASFFLTDGLELVNDIKMFVTVAFYEIIS
jgi:hypothetical protein